LLRRSFQHRCKKGLNKKTLEKAFRSVVKHCQPAVKMATGYGGKQSSLSLHAQASSRASRHKALRGYEVQEFKFYAITHAGWTLFSFRKEVKRI
jgi:hypothetical protein